MISLTKEIIFGVREIISVTPKMFFVTRKIISLVKEMASGVKKIIFLVTKMIFGVNKMMQDCPIYKQWVGHNPTKFYQRHCQRAVTRLG
jgi:hypothetical protein